MKKIIKTLTVAVILTFCSIIAFADGPPPPPPGGGNIDPVGPPVGAPIDGGLIILLALGAGYGGLKIYQYKKKELAGEKD